MIVRRGLHARGFRFRLHRKDLPGNPDIVLPKYRTIVFVHGCFWHSHPNCKRASRPATNQEFWNEKLDRNAQRDQRNYQALRDSGWKAVVIWECEIRGGDGWLERIVQTIEATTPAV